MEIVLGIVLGMALMAFVIYLYIRGLVREVMQELAADIERVADTLMPVTVERENGQIFCYGKEDKQFICQGATLEEIKAAFKQRFPDKTAYLDGGDETWVTELREEILRTKVHDAVKELNVKLD